jgi:arylsulfatase A-like enzyme
MSADWDVPLDATYPTLAEGLRDRGYVTGAFVGNNAYGRPEFGLSRGFMHYESRKYGLAAAVANSRLGNSLLRLGNQIWNSNNRPLRMTAPEINRRLLAWLPSRDSRPFFVFVNYFDAHEPYVASPPFNRFFRDTEPPTRRVQLGTRKSKAELRGLQDAYDQTIAYVDSQLGRLLTQLERRGLLANTVVVVTADHGEEFGEHGWASHGNGLYLPALRVPLVIFFPGHAPEGAVVAEPVTLRDLPATVLDLLKLPSPGSIPGNSLSSRWNLVGDSSRVSISPVLSEVRRVRNGPAWYAVAKGDMQAIVIGNYHYIRNGDGREELFDIVADPWEKTNLGGSVRYATALVAARSALDAAVRVGKGSVQGRARSSP